jgi:hypothetical protein
MKQSLILVILCIALFSCKSKTADEQAKTDSPTKIDYPFTPRYSINWQPGDPKNALIVLNCLKKYVAGDLKGAFENFADTVTFWGDQFYFKGKKDSLMKIFTPTRESFATLSKDFDTWATIYYSDKKETWVTLWYTERWTDKKGKKDSLVYVDDVLLRNGKILEYDEKMRRFPEPAMKK